MSMSYLFNSQGILADANADEVARARKIRNAWLAYQGDTPKPLVRKPGQADDNVCVNLARLSVDTSAFSLFGRDLEFEIADTEQDTPGVDATGDMLPAVDVETPADVYLENVWAANKQQTFLLKVGLNGAVCGQAFIKICEPRNGQQWPRLINLDPACMRVDWMPDDIDTVYRYVYTYRAIDPRTRRPMVYRQTTECDPSGTQWTVRDEESRPDSSVWTPVSQNVWPYPWPPVIDCQNLPAPNEYWGISDLEEDVQELGTAINFVLSNTARIIRFHAHPKTWGKGFVANDLKTGPDQVTILPNADAALANLEMQSDLASSIAYYERVKAAYHETTQVPEVTTGKFDNIGQLSGLALQILYGPLLQRTQVKRRTYGDMLEELNRRLLDFGGFGDANQVVTHWPEIVPSDPQAEAQMLQTHAAMGIVSKDTIATKLGYNTALEQAKVATEKKAGMQRIGDMQGAMRQDEPPNFQGG
jgi:hypothetical protein